MLINNTNPVLKVFKSLFSFLDCSLTLLSVILYFLAFSLSVLILKLQENPFADCFGRIETRKQIVNE
jgi:hypothetical protein